MVIKLYISGISGNKEVKKKQQRVQMILDSKQIDYEAIDITEPGKEKDKEFMQQNGKVRESLGKHPLPPQIFNDEDFCGDYEDFDLANEVDELEKFLHIETSTKDSETDSKKFNTSKLMMEAACKDDIDEKLIAEIMATESEDSNSVTERLSLCIDSLHNPYEYHTFKITYDGVNGLKEQIIDTVDVAGENVETEEKTKSEVNGEREAVLEASSENVTENVETSPEDVVPEKEESSTQENKTNDDNVDKEPEENVEDKEEHEDAGEAAEEGEEEKKEEVEAPNEEKVENEEASPPSEEKEGDEEKEEEEKKEDVESEEEEEKAEEKEEEKEEEEEDESEKSHGE